MRCAPFVVLALLLGLFLAPARAGAQEERPALAATLAACESGPEPVARFAVFTGSMPALAGTRRMWMRFDLLERRDTSRAWRRLRAPAFGRWERSKVPGASGFIYTKRIERLKEGARYRAVVRFRWLAADGRVQRETRRTTPVCTQPLQRPNLVVDAVAVVAGPDASTSRYLIDVVNAGLTPADAFTLGLVTGGRDLLREVPGIAAGGRTTVEVIGPLCEPGAPIDVTLDVRGVVRESNERDNASMTACGGR